MVADRVLDVAELDAGVAQQGEVRAALARVDPVAQRCQQLGLAADEGSTHDFPGGGQVERTAQPGAEAPRVAGVRSQGVRRQRRDPHRRWHLGDPRDCPGPSGRGGVYDPRVTAADNRAPGHGPATARLASLLARGVSAVDFWILFSARVSRRPALWIALHRLLAMPVLLRLRSHCFELGRGREHVRLRCRTRSPHVAWLLAGGDTIRAADAGTGDDDIEVTQVHPWTAWWWRRRGWLTVPAFVRYRAAMASIPPSRRSKSLRGNLARSRRNGLRSRAGGERDWAPAREMAGAWARARFGSEAWMPPAHAWTRMRRHGRLIVIGDGARDVGMAIVVRAAGGREAWFAALGIRDGDRALVRAGVSTALYAAALEEARRWGAPVFDSGRCSLRTDDPIAAYKRRWGLRESADPLSPVYAVRPLTAAGEQALAAMPLWVLGPRGRLVSARKVPTPPRPRAPTPDRLGIRCVSAWLR